MKMSELITEVSMKPKILKGFLDSEFAQDVTMGFECELIVPGLEDLQGHNIGIDESKNIPFPTGPDWKAKAFAWLVGGKAASSKPWITRQLDKFEKDWEEDRYQNYRDYIKLPIGRKKLRLEIAKLLPKGQNSDADIDSIISGDLGGDIFVKASTSLRNKFIAKNYKESQFLQDNQIETMMDFCDHMALKFPYKYEYKATTTIKKIAADFKRFTKFDVQSSKVYHEVGRKPNLWIFEPDGSLKDDTREGAGVELVSPPMPLAQGLQALNTVWSWAQSKNLRTNSSTGMHISISIPNHGSRKIDYLKLMMFLGDEYILKTFNRESNEYAQTLLNTIKKNMSNHTDLNEMLDKLKQGIDDIALRNVLWTSEKYVTVNIKKTYIEFRAPGGDYLNKKDQILNTVARYIKVLSIAADPDQEKKEYHKKLYKFIRLNITDDPDVINDVFRKFAAGEIDQNQMRMTLKRRNTMRKFRNRK